MVIKISSLNQEKQLYLSDACQGTVSVVKVPDHAQNDQKCVEGS